MDLRGRRILVVDDNAPLRRGIALALRDRSAGVEEAGDGRRAAERLRDPACPACDAVVTDLRLPSADGLEVLRAARERDPECPVLVMTAYGSVGAAVDAMRQGAFDFLEKPFELEELELRLARALAGRDGAAPRPRQPAAPGASAAGLIGHSPALREAVALAERVAPSRSTVLVTGETGTGKELLAGLVHAASGRAHGALVKVNCAAVPETLLESELFGHERGAFTGADRRRIGRFEEASGGTLFLDEVGELSPATQAKLLRVLQEQQFHRLGGTRSLRTDARIVAATNLDLQRAVRDGRFREDLLYRLDVIRIHMPPLRDRLEDVPPLAEHFLAGLGEPRGEVEGFTRGAISRLASHAWPGNVRELRNVVERAALMAEGPRIRSRDLQLRAAGPASHRAPGPGEAREASPGEWRPELPPPGWSLDDVREALIREALAATDFVQKDAAARLGVSRRKLNYMIAQLGITHPRWRRHRAAADRPTQGGLDSPPGKLNPKRPPGDEEDIGELL